MTIYNKVDFLDDDVLNVHLELLGLEPDEKKRALIRVMKIEINLLLGRDDVKHLELQSYLMMVKNFYRFV